MYLCTTYFQCTTEAACASKLYLKESSKSSGDEGKADKFAPLRAGKDKPTCEHCVLSHRGFSVSNRKVLAKMRLEDQVWGFTVCRCSQSHVK